MRIHSLLLAVVLSLTGSACTAQQPAPQQHADAEQYKPTATIRDIMDSMVDPSADAVWESVASYVTIKGIEEKAPRNDEEWNEVQRKAITLLEATNLLLIPGRHVAKPGEKADDPKIELAPDQIEKMINEDRAAWRALAGGLYDTIPPVVAAIDKRDAEALLNTGSAIEMACEKCHLKYWYPGDDKAAH